MNLSVRMKMCDLGDIAYVSKATQKIGRYVRTA